MQQYVSFAKHIISQICIVLLALLENETIESLFLHLRFKVFGVVSKLTICFILFLTHAPTLHLCIICVIIMRSIG